jgi:hypothetical protein
MLSAAADPGTRAVSFNRLLARAYAPIPVANLAGMSLRQLDEAFQPWHPSRATRRKAVSFFLKACRYAGVPLHPSMRVRTSPGVRGLPAPKPAASEPARAEFVLGTLGLSGGGELLLLIRGKDRNLMNTWETEAANAVEMILKRYREVARPA